MRFEIDRARGALRRGRPGIAMLPDRSARCIAAARLLYSGILDRIEAAGFDVFATRARVPTTAKVRVAAQALMGRRMPAPVGAALAAAGGHDRQQEPVGRPVVVVVAGMGRRDPAHVAVAAERETSEALVDQQIVHHDVGGAVGREAGADPEEGPQRLDELPHEHGGEHPEADHQRIAVVALDGGPGAGVVRPVPPPARGRA